MRTQPNAGTSSAWSPNCDSRQEDNGTQARGASSSTQARPTPPAGMPPSFAASDTAQNKGHHTYSRPVSSIFSPPPERPSILDEHLASFAKSPIETGAQSPHTQSSQQSSPAGTPTALAEPPHQQPRYSVFSPRPEPSSILDEHLASFDRNSIETAAQSADMRPNQQSGPAGTATPLTNPLHQRQHDLKADLMEFASRIQQMAREQSENASKARASLAGKPI